MYPLNWIEYNNCRHLHRQITALPKARANYNKTADYTVFTIPSGGIAMFEINVFFSFFVIHKQQKIICLKSIKRVENASALSLVENKHRW